MAQGHTEMIDLAKQTVGMQDGSNSEDRESLTETLQRKGKEAIEAVSGAQHTDKAGEHGDNEGGDGREAGAHDAAQQAC